MRSMLDKGGTTAIAGFGIEGFDGGFELAPRHDLVHFGQEDFATGLFFLVDCSRSVKLSCLLIAIPWCGGMMDFNGKVGTCSDLP
jgi:hypothetical protein